MPSSFTPFNWHELFQLGLAAGCAVLIGYEREVRSKPAGIPTMLIVTLASTLVMQLGFHLAALGGGVTPADPARIATAVITGIGFLGAGMIMRNTRAVYGVNTAATVWAMACIGLAIGAGDYITAGIVTVLVRVALEMERLRLSRIRGTAKEDPAAAADPSTPVADGTPVEPGG